MAAVQAAEQFRRKLERVMARAGQPQAAFARQIGIDRSTLSQLLSPANDRLPRAETLAAIARGCRVSADWLLGLSEREQIGAQMVEAPLEFEAQAHAPIDRRFMRWLDEAAGRRLRTVPMSFPDFLKSDAVAAWEYAPAPEAMAEFQGFRARILGLIGDGAAFEVCAEVQAIEAFATGAAQWAGLDGATRAAQLRDMARSVEALYPSLRLFLYDLRQTYSAPFTLFGRQRAALYLGPTWLVLNASEHIALLDRRFDELVRLATVQPHEAAAHLASWAERA